MSGHLKNYAVQEFHASRMHILDYWIKSCPLHLNRAGDQGVESNHSRFCTRVSFGRFVQPAQKVFEFLERRKDFAKELNIKLWE